jgi:hypothetical protein
VLFLPSFLVNAAPSKGLPLLTVICRGAARASVSTTNVPIRPSGGHAGVASNWKGMPP